VAYNGAMRILLVEDDSTLGDALGRALRGAGYVLDWARDGAMADSALRDQLYEAIILDLGLPHLDGFEILRRMRARKSTVPVLILSARDGLDDRVKGLDLGADDFLAKPFMLPELEARLRALLRRGGRQGTPGPVVRYGALTLEMRDRTVTVNDEPLALSGRELSVLEILLLRGGRVVSKEALLENLCDWNDEMGNNAIEVYIHRLRRKLSPYGVSIRTVRGLGYLLEKTMHE